MAHWRCISGCGACCRLDPSLRGEDLDCLDDDQRRTYLAMVGEDGWCIHFDTGGRRCRIYDSRPDFCRVENLVALFAGGSDQPPAASPAPKADAAPPDDEPGDLSPEPGGKRLSRQDGPGQVEASSSGERECGLDAAGQALAIASCRTQIRAEYGGRGRVMRRFEQAIRRTP